MRLHDFRLVLIEWEDACSTDAWVDAADKLIDRAMLCRSVGWLMLDGASVKVVASHTNEEPQGVLNQVCGVMTIPTRSVLRIVDIPLTREDA